MKEDIDLGDGVVVEMVGEVTYGKKSHAPVKINLFDFGKNQNTRKEKSKEIRVKRNLHKINIFMREKFVGE